MKYIAKANTVSNTLLRSNVIGELVDGKITHLYGENLTSRIKYEGARMKFKCNECSDESFYLHVERQWVCVNNKEFHKLDNLYDMFDRNSDQRWFAYCCNCYGTWGPGDCLETLEGIMKGAGVLK